MEVDFDLDVAKKMPGLPVCLGSISHVRVMKDNEHIKRLKRTVYDEVRKKHTLEELKDDPTVRAYRDFYWKLDVDPTKTRPSGEALLRRVLHGSDLPTISNVVDAYNLASMKTIVPISGFDRDRLSPPFQVRFARGNEPFNGIGMTEPLSLNEKVLVMADQKQVLSIYPYRDSDRTKIILGTRNVLIVAYGAPGISREKLKEAVETTIEYINAVSNGKTETIEVFNAPNQDRDRIT